MYADDLVLLACSINALQKMINICVSVASELDIMFNVKKSAVIRIGKAYNHKCLPGLLNGYSINFVSKVKYLGSYICAGRRFKISLDEHKAAFY